MTCGNRSFLLAIVLAAWGGVSAEAACGDVQITSEVVSGRKVTESRPNVVVFLVDDLGQTDLACYGSSFYETPHIDRLATQGIRLTNAYSACPVCSPARASLITGRYPQRTGITDYIGAAQPAKWKRNTKLLPAEYSERLSLEETTLPEVLKAGGYATFFAGKWHLGGEGFLPEDQGFDINRGGLSQGGPYGGKKYFSPYGNAKLVDGPPGEHLPDRLASETVKFIEDHSKQPFLAYLSFYSVHTPLMSRDDLKAKYESKRAGLKTVDVFEAEPPRKVRMSQDHAVYAGMVEAMDQAVGKVLKSLDDLGIADNTLVIFTSDNGGLSTSEGSPTSNFPLRAGKGWLYEGGLRTAGIVRWPSRLPAGVTSDVPIITPDYFATVLDATGCRLQDAVSAIGGSAEPVVDGVSLLSLLDSSTGEAAQQAAISRPLFWHYPHYGNQGGAPGAAIRAGDWKLIRWFEDDVPELFDLSKDPSEQHNLADSEPEKVAELQRLLSEWQTAVGARMTSPNSAHDPNKPGGRG